MRKLRIRDMKSFAQGYTADRGQTGTLAQLVSESPVSLPQAEERQALQLGWGKPWDFQLKMSLFIAQTAFLPCPAYGGQPLGPDLCTLVTLAPRYAVLLSLPPGCLEA